MEKKREYYDVAVIGAGPAGLTAGIYCGRARLKTIVFEKALPGGLATYTSEIENYPGFEDPISGNELMKQFGKQAKRLGAEIKLTAVKSVDLSGAEKVISTFRTDYVAKAVIVAAGGKPRLTGAAGEENFLYDKGISFCATCDAAFYTDKTVMVIGSGDAAIEEAMFLTKFAKQVFISVIHDEGIVDANEIAREHAFANKKLTFLWNTMVHEFAGGERLETVVLKNVKTGELQPTPVDGCFLFIGYLPDTEVFQSQLEMNPQGYVVTNEEMMTSRDGVFAAGDVRVKSLRQVATAVGDGAIAGVGAERYLAEEAFYREFIQAEEPILLYCWNPTLPLCREIMTAVEQIKQKYAGRIRVITVDTYKSQGLAKRVGVTQAPAVVVLHQGQSRFCQEGCTRDLSAVEAKLQELL